MPRSTLSVQSRGGSSVESIQEAPKSSSKKRKLTILKEVVPFTSNDPLFFTRSITLSSITDEQSARVSHDSSLDIPDSITLEPKVTAKPEAASKPQKRQTASETSCVERESGKPEVFYEIDEREDLLDTPEIPLYIDIAPEEVREENGGEEEYFNYLDDYEVAVIMKARALVREGRVRVN
ncbi:MAG: hypothetical protein MMC23_007913 [Stictis urceolatum]|nr:hypothetical protein [Stictis urceolata]